MDIRSWQQKIIDDFPSIVEENRRFILKAPTGAGKTFLASELIKRFYNKKKVIVLCHRLVLLEQLEKALQADHTIKKLAVSETSIAFDGYDILLSTNMRAKEIIADAIPMADLVIVDEAHRISPNGRGYKAIIDNFKDNSKESARFMGLTASPERRTGDQRDQLHLAFDSIIDCADIQNLIDEKILVPPIYKPYFVHDLDLTDIDISSGDFPTTKLASAIVKSSMIEYSVHIYQNERDNVSPKPISAWFCPDVSVAEVTVENIEKVGISCAIVTAQTPLNERMKVLAEHEKGNIEAVVSVGVLLEGWDNPNCNIIVHLRPTLSKVLWGQSVGRGLRSAKDKSKCLVIDVSSNWSTFGPVEKLKWELWSHRRSYLKFKNRFNWIAEQLNEVEKNEVYLLCQNQLPNKMRCSYIYKKSSLSDEACPMCGTFDATDIHKEQMLDSTQTEAGLHQLFFDRIPKVYEEMNLSIWKSLGKAAWNGSNEREKMFLVFCKAFEIASGEATASETKYWDLALEAETTIRKFLVENNIQIVKQDDFELAMVADGLSSGKVIRSLQSNYGISVCGGVMLENSELENERKYQKAIKIAERLTIMGCSSRDVLPYFNASEYLSSLK